MAHQNSRLKQFELQLADDRRRQTRRAQRDTGGYGYHNAAAQRSRNTLGPQEDVIEHRRHRNRVAMTASPENATRNILAENLFLLSLLSGSIYGIYRLCIYILNL